MLINSTNDTNNKTCIELCYHILERSKRHPGDDSAIWDFFKCLNDCNYKKMNGTQKELKNE